MACLAQVRNSRVFRRLLSGFSAAMLAAMLLAAVRPARAAVTLTLDVKDGDTVADVARIVAHATSDDTINKVEFRVDDQLRFTGSSTPYVFSWDTLADSEGPHKLEVTATDGAGATKTASVSLKIDNELSLGAPALLLKAQTALASGDTAAAMNYSHRTLKVAPDNVDASRVVAAVYASQSDLDRAIAALNGAKNLNSSGGALIDLVTYRLQRELLPENVAHFTADLPGIMEQRQKGADLAVTEAKSRAGSSAGDSAEAYRAVGDALMAARRYPEAMDEYKRIPGVEGVTLAALAQILGGSAHDALGVMKTQTQAGDADAASRAVYGLALLEERQFAAARAAVASGVTAEVPAALVVGAYADAAQVKMAAALAEAKAAASKLPMAPEVHYALSMAVKDLDDSESDLEQTIVLAPQQTGPLLDFALRIALRNRPQHFERALQIIDFVLQREPNNVNAKLMKILLLVETKQSQEAGRILDPLLRRPPVSADILMTAAVYFGAIGQDRQAENYTAAANKLDSEHAGQALLEKPIAFLARINRTQHYRAMFFLSSDTLYPRKP